MPFIFYNLQICGPKEGVEGEKRKIGQDLWGMYYPFLNADHLTADSGSRVYGRALSSYVS